MVRRSPRALALRVVAVVVAVVTAVVVASDLAAFHRRAAVISDRNDRYSSRHDDLPVGPELDSRRRRRPPGPPIRVAGGRPRGLAPSRVVGRVVAVAVLRGNYLAVRNLAPRRRLGLDGAFPAGCARSASS